MIKAGAYGILRVAGMIFTLAKAVVKYATDQVPALWSTTQVIGYGVIWIGIITIFAGVCLALVQENSKRMLSLVQIVTFQPASTHSVALYRWLF